MASGGDFMFYVIQYIAPIEGICKVQFMDGISPAGVQSFRTKSAGIWGNRVSSKHGMSGRREADKSASLELR